jgi:hypothetical protein
MITDGNNVMGLAYDLGLNVAGGNMIFLGILVFICIALLLVLSKAKAGTSILIIASTVFALSLLTSEFLFVFWIILLVSVIILVNGLRKRFTGQT